MDGLPTSGFDDASREVRALARPFRAKADTYRTADHGVAGVISGVPCIPLRIRELGRHSGSLIRRENGRRCPGLGAALDRSAPIPLLHP